MGEPVGVWPELARACRDTLLGAERHAEAGKHRNIETCKHVNRYIIFNFQFLIFRTIASYCIVLI